MAAKKLHFYPNLNRWVLLFAVAILLTYGCELQETDFIEPIPVALEAKEVSSTSFMASWKGVLGSTGYQIDVSTDPQFAGFVSGYQSREVDSLSFPVTGLTAESQYYYRVRAKKGKTISDNSNVIGVITRLLSTPVALPATDIQVFGFTANWEPVEEAISYVLEVATDPDFANVFNEMETDSLSLGVTGLIAETTYYYRVRAQKEKATSGYSNVISVNSEPIPAPLALPASNSKVFQFTANWEKVNEAASYVIEVATDSGFNNLLAAYNGIEVVSDSMVVLDLDFRKTYYYRLKAKRLHKESAYSNTVEVKPVITESCRLSKMSNQYTEYGFEYDANGRLTNLTVFYTWDEYLMEYRVSYTNDSTVNEVQFYQNGVFYEKYRLSYNNGLMTSMDIYDSYDEFLFHSDYLYNNSQQCIGLRQYRDEEKTELVFSEDYELDTHGNVLKVYNQDAVKVRDYRYDEKFNPKMLIMPELRQFIKDDFSGFNGKIFPGLYNPIYARIDHLEGYIEEEVFIYDYNSRDVALGRKGYYVMEYEFTGCDF